MTLNMMADTTRVVTGGVDTHKDFHVAVVVDQIGRVVDHGQFDADVCGYGELVGWMEQFGDLALVGVEGTGSYGKGLARFLTSAGVAVVEVSRPDRALRRARGKSDRTDAEAAALTALNGRHSGAPKIGGGGVESLRLLRIARDSVISQTTAVRNQIGAILDTAPEPVIARYRHLPPAKRQKALLTARPGPGVTKAETAAVHALGSLARQRRALDAELTVLDAHNKTIVSTIAPQLLARAGVGPHTAAALLICAGGNPDRLGSPAAFAKLCGAAPIDAASGKTQNRHRLNRGGDRRANSALWRITMTRMWLDPRTKTYVERRTAQGLSTREIMRCLKTYIAKELHPVIIADLEAM